MPKRAFALALLIASFSLASRSATAQNTSSLSFAPNAPSIPHIRGGFLFDNSFRALFRAPLAVARSDADNASTVLLWTMVALPYASAAMNTLALGGSWRDAAGLALVNSEAFALAFGATFVLKTLVARERPYATAANLSAYCSANPDDAQCGSDRNASFPSGHSAAAFTAAGLLCTQSIYLGPRTGWDAMSCSSAMAVATVTAVLRMVADMHYASDTMAGAAIGLGAGLLLPIALHFAPWAPFPIARPLRSVDTRGFAEAAHAAERSGAQADEPLPPTRSSRWPIANLQIVPWATEGGGGIAIGGLLF